MDRDYFQHVEEASSSALRTASRALAIAVYGMIGVYVLSIAAPAASPVVVSDVLPRMINANTSVYVMANGPHEYEMMGHGEF